MTATETRLAEVKLDVKTDWDAAVPVTGRGYSAADAPLIARPKDVRLENDGVYEYWLESDSSWTLEHDGVGWRAISEAWPSSQAHVMRLADAAGPRGTFVESLSLVGGGAYQLQRGVTYRLRLGADQGMSRTVIILSR